MGFKQPSSAQHGGCSAETWGSHCDPRSGRSSGAAGTTTDLGYSNNLALLQRMDPACNARLFRSPDAMKQALPAQACCPPQAHTGLWLISPRRKRKMSARCQSKGEILHLWEGRAGSEVSQDRRWVPLPSPHLEHLESACQCPYCP